MTQQDAELLAAVRALADAWNEIPDYTATTYDQGRVDQRHMMLGELLEVLEPALGPS